ncbi:MAG: hypothetical protein KDK25_13420, partial [Leptospiraceae bacterium]|nr:hypothetical protein [Leptospiraceae bacterium]
HPVKPYKRPNFKELSKPKPARSEPSAEESENTVEPAADSDSAPAADPGNSSDDMEPDSETP